MLKTKFRLYFHLCIHFTFSNTYSVSDIVQSAEGVKMELLFLILDCEMFTFTSGASGPFSQWIQGRTLPLLYKLSSPDSEFCTVL